MENDIGQYLVSIKSNVINAIKHKFPRCICSEELDECFSESCVVCLQSIAKDPSLDKEKLREIVFDAAFKKAGAYLLDRREKQERIIKNRPHRAYIDMKTFLPIFVNNLTPMQKKVYLLRRKAYKIKQISSEIGISQTYVCTELRLIRRRYFRFIQRRSLYRPEYLEVLPKCMREIFKMSYEDGLRSCVIAAKLNKSQNYINVILSHGKRLLINKEMMQVCNKTIIYDHKLK